MFLNANIKLKDIDLLWFHMEGLFVVAAILITESLVVDGIPIELRPHHFPPLGSAGGGVPLHATVKTSTLCSH